MRRRGAARRPGHIAWRRGGRGVRVLVVVGEAAARGGGARRAGATTCATQREGDDATSRHVVSARRRGGRGGAMRRRGERVVPVRMVTRRVRYAARARAWRAKRRGGGGGARRAGATTRTARQEGAMRRAPRRVGAARRAGWGAMRRRGAASRPVRIVFASGAARCARTCGDEKWRRRGATSGERERPRARRGTRERRDVAPRRVGSARGGAM